MKVFVKYPGLKLKNLIFQVQLSFKETKLKNFCKLALDTALSKGASYVDIRFVESKDESITVKNANIGRLIQEETIGYGIRVIKNGAWGFASTDKITNEDIKKTALLAINIAEASFRLKRKNVLLAPEPAYQDIWISPYTIDPFKISLDEKLKLMYKTDSILRKSKLIKQTKVFLKFLKEHKFFASSEGSFIEQYIISSGGGFSVDASNGDDIQTRSYPLSFEGVHKTTGYEIIPALDFIGNAERVREEAITLLTAKNCPGGEKRNIILMPNQLVLQIHESTGHASELDRVLGYEADFAGTSFLTTEKLNNFKYGSDIVNLVADSTLPTGLATQGYDDDGVKAKRWHIVKNGIHTGYMVNRETAHETGLSCSYGCNRSQGYADIPITRITNLSLMPVKGTLKELIENTDDAILMDNNRCWSIDQKRLNFQFGCEVGWHIKKGKIGKMFKNPYYQGITPEFWNSCDYICGPEEWQLLGVLNCGKGQPMQINKMSHGSSPARFKNVMLGQ